MKNVGVIAFCMVFVLVVSGCGGSQTAAPQEAAGESVTIGFMGPLTGSAASYGESIRRGVDLALEESGLENVAIVYEDSRCEADEAVSAVNKLISVDGVQAIVGDVCSGATLAAAPVAGENGVVMISAASTSPAISDRPGVFRTVPSDRHQGRFGAELAASRGFEKMAVLYSNEDYGLGFRRVLEEEFPFYGGEIVAAEAFERGVVDLRAQLTKIKGSGADVIYVISNAPDSSVAALKQARELGIEAVLIGSEGLKSDDILTGAAEAAEGLILTSVSEGNDDFVRRYKAKYGESSEPGPFAAQGYDAFTALAGVIGAGQTTREGILNNLGTVEFEGAAGYVSFDENGDVREGVYDVYVVENGAFVRE